MFISGYQANIFSGGKTSLGFGEKHGPKEMNYTHKTTGSPGVKDLMNPSVAII